jgi:hypothetical protein
MDMLSRCLCSCCWCDWAGKMGKVEHLEGKGGEQVVPILRFQGGSPYLCRLRTASLWP